MILRFYTIFLVIAGSAVSLRCMCSTTAGGVNCYSGWCDVHNWNGKVGACAVVRVGSRQHFACVRVKESSEDACKVDRRNGELQVRCWCRKSDYCNIDLADRVEDGDLLSEKFKEESIIKAEELSTVSMEKILPQKDEFVIEKTYDVNDENYPIYSPDIITGVEETDTFSMLPSSAKPEPSLPARSIEQLITVNRYNILSLVYVFSTGLTKTTIPPWRREVPVPLEPASTSQRMLFIIDECNSITYYVFIYFVYCSNSFAAT
uniref:Activin_recp domain-containing protein n=1 Tax=Heterorhabditis bacteriophora TaxID=37862 RepID=A0A1I7XEL8_HETBA